LITKAIIKHVDWAGNKCLVRIPLFETASSDAEVECTALINIPPGIFNNLYPGDIVFIGFEENAIEKPIILGKLYRGANFEINARGGNGNFDHLQVFTSASVPCDTNFVYPEDMAPEYADYDTPKELADRIKELRDYINLLSEHHEMDMEILRLYLQPWNVEVDDGNLDSNAELIEIAKSTSQENAIITAMPPTLHNDCIPANWPLKISPNQDVKGQLEDDIVLGTAGKNNYYPAK
jgi:hypothetical protein